MQKLLYRMILWMIILTTGCQSFQPVNSPGPITPDSGEEPLSTPQPVSPTQGATMPSSTPNTSGMEILIEMAKNDLAQRLSISVNEITLVDAQAVVWPNASLGCPQEGMFYAEVLTPGYLILLSAGNIEYEYHAGSRTEVVYCENPLPPVPGVPGDG